MPGIDDLLQHADDHARSFEPSSARARPAKRIAVVACMDARLDLFAILGLAVGDAHIIRNAGGVVTDDVVRSLLISQHLLGTEEILVVHHTDCGMLSFRDDELKDRVTAAVGIRPPFALEAFTDLDDDVRQSVARIMASPFVAHKDAVRGAVYEVETGRLRVVA